MFVSSRSVSRWVVWPKSYTSFVLSTVCILYMFFWNAECGVWCMAFNIILYRYYKYKVDKVRKTHWSDWLMNVIKINYLWIFIEKATKKRNETHSQPFLPYHRIIYYQNCLYMFDYKNPPPIIIYPIPFGQHTHSNNLPAPASTAHMTLLNF